MYLDALSPMQPWLCGLEPMLGSAHRELLTVVGFPTATTPGILDDLNRLPFDLPLVDPRDHARQKTDERDSCQDQAAMVREAEIGGATSQRSS